MTHSVVIKKAPKLQLVNADLVIQVRKNGSMLGHLHVSKGAIEWRLTKKEYRRKLSWKNFDAAMKALGRRKKTRRKQVR